MSKLSSSPRERTPEGILTNNAFLEEVSQFLSNEGVPLTGADIERAQIVPMIIERGDENFMVTLNTGRKPSPAYETIWRNLQPGDRLVALHAGGTLPKERYLEVITVTARDPNPPVNFGYPQHRVTRSTFLKGRPRELGDELEGEMHPSTYLTTSYNSTTGTPEIVQNALLRRNRFLYIPAESEVGTAGADEASQISSEVRVKMPFKGADVTEQQEGIIDGLAA